MSACGYQSDIDVSQLNIDDNSIISSTFQEVTLPAIPLGSNGVSIFVPNLLIPAGSIKTGRGLRWTTVGSFIPSDPPLSNPLPRIIEFEFENQLIVRSDPESDEVGFYKAEIVVFNESPGKQQGFATLLVDEIFTNNAFSFDGIVDMLVSDVMLKTNVRGTGDELNLVSRQFSVVEKI